MKTQFSWFGGKRVAKAIVLFVAFLFVITPLAPVFADDSGNANTSSPATPPAVSPDPVVSNTPPVDPTINPPVDVPPVDSPPADIPPIDPVIEPLPDPEVPPATEDISLDEPIDNGLSTSKTKILPNVDGSTGALNYSYPIVVPPGRSGLAPSVSLTYNNQSKNDGVFGVSWSSNIPYIERLNKKGVDSLYADNYFNSSVDGELVNVSGTEYRPKVENGQFLKYVYDGNSWTITDKSGAVYKYGFQASARQDNPADSTKVFKWMLEETRDVNDNYITYEYYKNSGQIYPSKITYTGNGATAGIFTVNFDRVSRTNSFSSYTTGFLVTTSYQISEIRTEISGTWARKYSLAYTNTDNGVGLLLDTVIESGKDESGTITALPAVNFDYQTSTPGWTYDENKQLPLSFLYGQGDIGMRMADINGDGLNDILCSNKASPGDEFCATDHSQIWLNTGSAWELSTTWSLPHITSNPNSDLEAFTDSSYHDTGLFVADLNGDGLPDLARQTAQNISRAYINNGVNGWDYNDTWELPRFMSVDNEYGKGARIADINGDGLPDLLCHTEVASNSYCRFNQPLVLLNTGSGWEQSTSWTFPHANGGTSTNFEAFVDSTGKSENLELMDINGDGLTDMVKAVYSGSGSPPVYLNNGSNGWNYDPNWILPNFLKLNGPRNTTRFDDINGDGLPDILCHTSDQSEPNCGRDYPKILLNTGPEFTQFTNWNFPTIGGNPNPAHTREAFSTSSTADTGLRLIDINGDGSSDMVRGSGDTNYSYINNNSSEPNNLTKITYAQGGSTDITYKASANFVDGAGTPINPNLPLHVNVVSQITNNDGLGIAQTRAYSYEGGRYYFNTFLDRKFAGFAITTETDAAGNVTKTYYHQGDGSNTSLGEYQDDVAKIGKPYRVEQYDDSSHLYALIVNKWDKFNQGTGRDFVKQITKTTLTYDGNSTHKDTAEEYTYENTYGNLTQKVSWGQVNANSDGSFTDTGTDKQTENIYYAFNGVTNVIGLPYDRNTVDQSGVKIRGTRTYYDSYPFGLVGKGNPTKISQWVTGGTYVNNQNAYDGTYGLVTSTTDARGKVTNYSYDSYNLYPTTVTNPLNQAIQYSYDYSLGKPKQVTDPNNRVYQTVFDGFDRVIAEKQPDLSAPASLIDKTVYTYTDSSGNVRVKKTDFLDNSTSVDTYTYFDGLDRPIQTRKEMEDGNFSTSDTVYGTLGQVHKQSLPYSSSGSAKTSPTTTAALLSTYSYDPMMRVMTETNTLGTVTNTYDDWKNGVTDLRGKNKYYYNDALGNLVRVDELNGASTYSTYYEYNGNNKLTKITDALGNIRNFTYNGLGDRLTAQDLHGPTDTIFGTWTYAYDASGNLTSTLDPKNQTVNYTYDDINRTFTEDFIGLAGTEITYAYDSGTDGIGRLSSVTAPGTSTTYTYDANGNTIGETKVIDSSSFVTTYTYDRQGNQLVITNPDNSKVKNTYNTAGQLETVQRKEILDLFFSNVVTNLNYGVTGSVTRKDFQNGSYTVNTYDPTKLYRLSHKVTTIAGNVKAQDASYTYDANGNITQIVDASATNSAKTVDYTYDDLNRLLSATASGVASGQSPYTQTYTYNAIGNILTRSDVSGSYYYMSSNSKNYANPNAVISIGSVNYSYDNNGNLLTETGGLSNTWDYNNRLTQTVKNGITSSYKYDSSGQRVKLSNGSTTTYYPNSNYNTDGTTAVKHIFANGEMVATVKGTGSGAIMYSEHIDHLNGGNVVTNSSGAVEELMDYFPYGNIRLDQQTGSFNEQRKYTGHEFDVDTGLVYAKARYYNSSIGRFASQDPLFIQLGDNQAVKRITGKDINALLSDPQFLNSYSYVRNNPINLTDPDGQWILDLIAGKQSWNSFQVEAGDAANILYNGSSTWHAAMDHPIIAGAVVGVVGGTAAYGGAAVATHLSTTYLGGTGTACLALCNKTDQIPRVIENAKNLALQRQADLENSPNKARAVLDSFSKQTFPNIMQSIRYHVGLHGDGDSSYEYTSKAINFFVNNANRAVPMIDRTGNLALKISGNEGGWFTTTGKVITYWNNH